MLGEEEWFPTLRAPEHYWVTKSGRVRSKFRERKVKVDRHGYVVFHMSVNGEKTTARVDHLVLETFVGSRPEGMQSCHFPDRDKTNNHIDNLMWGDPDENALHRKIHGTQLTGEKLGNATLTNAEADEIRKRYGPPLGGGRKHPDGLTYESLAKEYNTNSSTIGYVIAGESYAWQ